MLDGHLGRDVEVDLCEPCQSLWFDGERTCSSRPAAPSTMFRAIGEHVRKPELRGRRAGEVSTLQGAAAAHAGHAAQHPVRIFPLPQRSRPADRRSSIS